MRFWPDFEGKIGLDFLSGKPKTARFAQFRIFGYYPDGMPENPKKISEKTCGVLPFLLTMYQQLTPKKNEPTSSSFGKNGDP